MNIHLRNSQQLSIIDDEDFDRIVKLSSSWFLAKNGYVVCNTTIKYKVARKPTQVYLHRFITNCPSDLVVDHINNNPLDNRKENLRCIPHGDNLARMTKRKNTSSKYKGVYFDSQANKWKVEIVFNGQKIHGGFFLEEDMAGSRAKDLYLQYKKYD